MRVLNRKKKKLLDAFTAEDLKKIKEMIDNWSTDPTRFVILPHPVDILPDGTIVPQPPMSDQKDKD